MAAEEWLALPWWQRKLYIEGWNREQEMASGEDDGAAREVSSDAAGLAGLGIEVERVS